MSRIGRAAVYKFLKTERILIYSISKIEMGAGIATEPFIWLEKGATSEQVVTACLVAMSQSKIGLPNPKDWPSFTKEFLKKIGFSKESELYKNSKSLSVLHMNETITFSPMENKGSKGFVNIKDSEIKLKDDSSIEELIKAFDLALTRCE